MATLDNDDLKAIEKLIEVTLDDKLEEKLDTKLSHLPTKDEFYEETGKILKRLDDLEQEKDVLSHQVMKHNDRIEKIETRLGISTN